MEMFFSGCDEEVLLGDNPPEKIAFQVIIDYETFLHRDIFGVIPSDSLVQESDPILSFPEAMEIAKEVASEVGQKFSDSKIVDIEDDGTDWADGFLFLVTDSVNEIIAGIAVETLDYREETIH